MNDFKYYAQKILYTNKMTCEALFIDEKILFNFVICLQDSCTTWKILYLASRCVKARKAES